MNVKVHLLWSQSAVTRRFPEPDESNPHAHTLFIDNIKIQNKPVLYCELIIKFLPLWAENILFVVWSLRGTIIEMLICFVSFYHI
jgi:hypothetical protein